MQLTIKQEQGLKIAVDRFKDNEKYTTISGFAGTGKSTLVKFIIDALDVDPSKVAYVAYTGKAAEVLRKKGNANALTLHKLLYDSIPRPGGGFFRKPKMRLDYTIVVVDECSMVPKTMVDMLLKHKVYIIFLGDPFQLPVIDKNEENHLLDHPHIFLDEIMRQAAESEIIQLTMKIRKFEPFEEIKGDEVKIFNKNELNTGMLLWADQVICATNLTRFNLNNQIRELLGYTGTIQNGEKLIIKRNYWDCINQDNNPLVNGMTGTIINPIESFRRIPSFIQNDRHDLPIIIGNFIPDGDLEFSNLEIDKDFLLKETPCVNWRVAYKLGQLKMRTGEEYIPKEITYGYCITGHAAQGSEWDKVLVIEERFPFDKKEHARWLYTACTRAAEKLVLVR